MAAKKKCPNCGNKVSADFRIFANATGFKATAIGLAACRACGKPRPMQTVPELQTAILARMPA